MRQRNRYLVFKIHSEKKFKRADIVNAVQEKHLQLYGELASGIHNLWVMDWYEKKKKGIVKTTNKSPDYIRGCLTLITEIDGKKAVFEVIKTTGTLKKARNLIEKD